MRVESEKMRYCLTEEDCPADKVRHALEEFIALFGLDAKKRDSRSWMEILA